jgi:succinoglycan biosynthesis protein ExoM
VTHPHITVCVCTFKRQELLKRLFLALDRQESNGCFSYSVVVVDNDIRESAKSMVEEMSGNARVKITYLCEPEQNIALARNKAISAVLGELIAFIDDDEVPGSDWLLKLLDTCREYNSDGVLGPVKPYFDEEPPAWVIKGKFFDRPTHQTGFTIAPSEGRTGNLLFKRSILEGVTEPFKPEYGSGGEDRDFFRRMIGAHKVFVWCDEAPVHELVPASRWNRGFMLRRALLRGKMALNHSGNFSGLLKSVLAVAAYGILLPFLLLRHDWFMKYLISICDHGGKLLAFLGVDVIREKYLSQ